MGWLHDLEPLPWQAVEARWRRQRVGQERACSRAAGLVGSSSAEAQGAECVSGLRESGALLLQGEAERVLGAYMYQQRTGKFLLKPILANVQKDGAGAVGQRPGDARGRVHFILRHYLFGAASPHRTVSGRKVLRVCSLESASRKRCPAVQSEAEGRVAQKVAAKGRVLPTAYLCCR